MPTKEMDYGMNCCDGADSPALFAIANMIYSSVADKTLNVHFDHGLGDCVHFVAFCKVLREKYGVTIRIHSEGNKRDVFRAAGIEYCELEGALYHRWTYPPDFNYPEVIDGDGSKLYGNILMKTEAERREFYEAVCNADMRDMLPTIVTDVERNKVAALLRGLPEPFVLIHLWGSNLRDSKNIDNHTEVFNALLDKFNGTIICLDWDYRAEVTKHSRIRHLDRDLHLSSIAELAALYDRGSLLIGVDSGPFHLSAMHDIPALGVFHHHYPACVGLPSVKQAVLTRDAESYKRSNAVRRKRWNVIEYAGHLPNAEDIARNAARMLEGSRYGGQDAAADTMLQQWVRDWLRQSTSLCARADRDITMDYLFREIPRRYEWPLIIETGCIRANDDWSAGYSTYLFAVLLQQLGRGMLITVDNNKQNLEFALDKIKSHGFYSGQVTPVNSDSVEYFKQYGERPIDVLFLDSLDAENPNHANYALKELQTIEPHLHNGSIVVFDDTAHCNGQWIGKGALAVPYLIAKDWLIKSLGYQVIMSRN